MAESLKAVIEWTEAGASVKTMENLDLPRRTAVGLALPTPQERKAPGTIEEVTVFISSYRCLDCDFETPSLEVMREHQKPVKPSLGHRIKRLLGLTIDIDTWIHIYINR